MNRVFLDMDGTLAKWNQVSTEELWAPGYFLSLEPDERLIGFISKIYSHDIVESYDAVEYFTEKTGLPGNFIYTPFSVYILSAALSEEKIEEKNTWLDRYFPRVPRHKRIFTVYGERKAKVVTDNFGRIDQSYILVDDHTQNLLDWSSAGGYSIKYLNGINGLSGRWNGAVLDGNALPKAVENIY